MLSVWIDFRLDMHGLKMRALQRVVDVKTTTRTIQLVKTCKLGFFGSLVLKEGTEKPHQVQVTISLTFN